MGPLEELNQHSLEELKWRVKASPLTKSLRDFESKEKKREGNKPSDCEPQEPPRG